LQDREASELARKCWGYGKSNEREEGGRKKERGKDGKNGKNECRESLKGRK
jgi:hypothetical protein